MLRLRVLVAVVGVVAPLVPGARAAAAVPQGFVGMNGDGALFSHRLSLSHQLNTMAASGVQSIRVVFSWAQAQPTRNGPIGFAATDQIVGMAARRHLTVLPVVINAPAWDQTSNPGGIASPADPAPYANYLAQLVRRYGPGGSFWPASHIPAVPIRMWQLWNEPELASYWPTQPFARSYVALLRASYNAIKGADSGAKVVLAGMPNFVWTYLDAIYNVPGASKLFDVVAVHPYTKEPAGVITILQRVRNEMNRHGDARKPMLATEISWPSSLGQIPVHTGFETTETGQASNLAALLPMLASDRQRLGLIGFYYYTWVTEQNHGSNVFQFAGLLSFHDSRLRAKPAFSAFRRAALALERIG